MTLEFPKNIDTPKIDSDDQFRRVERELNKPENQEKRVIVEVGPGDYPFFLFPASNRNLEKDELYIGVELNRKGYSSVQGAKKTVDERSRTDQFEKNNVILINGRGDCLPIGDGKADEVLFKNVFGIHDKYISTAGGFIHHGRIISDMKKDMIEEAKRILKEGGKLVIVETCTPDNAADVMKILENDHKFRMTKKSNDVKDIRVYEYMDDPDPQDYAYSMKILDRPFVAEYEKLSEDEIK